jgi:hypothetical protein
LQWSLFWNEYNDIDSFYYHINGCVFYCCIMISFAVFLIHVWYRLQMFFLSCYHWKLYLFFNWLLFLFYNYDIICSCFCFKGRFLYMNGIVRSCTFNYDIIDSFLLHESYCLQLYFLIMTYLASFSVVAIAF